MGTFFIIKLKTVTKPEFQHPSRVLWIQNSAYRLTEPTDLLNNSQEYLFGSHKCCIIYIVLNLRFKFSRLPKNNKKKKLNGKYIHLLANPYKMRLNDSAGEFKDVTRSMFPEKTFHSLS